MNVEDPGYALDCGIVGVSLARGMFARLTCGNVYVAHTDPLGHRLHALCEVYLSFWFDSPGAVRLIKDTRTYTACMFMREN